MPSNSLISLAKTLLQIQQNATALTIYRRDTPGYLYLKEYAPHIASQLDEYTLNWTLIPKAMVFNEEMLHQMVGVYRSNLEYGISPELPKEVTKEQYLSMVTRLYDFLENEVAPYLAKMPKPEVEEEVDADVAKELEGYDINGDVGEDGGEDSKEAPDNKESS